MKNTNGQTKGKKTNHVPPWLTPLVIRSLSKMKRDGKHENIVIWKKFSHAKKNLKMEALCVFYKVIGPMSIKNAQDNQRKVPITIW
jgi:hypothetical protein